MTTTHGTRHLLTGLAVVAGLAAAGGFAGCATGSPLDDDCVCTAEFRRLTVTVVDAAGNPVEGVAISVSSTRTGRIFPVQDADLGDGRYVIFDDSFRFLIREEGEAIRVSGQKDGASFSAQFLIGTDDCRCHVQRLSGPDTVTLS